MQHRNAAGASKHPSEIDRNAGVPFEGAVLSVTKSLVAHRLLYQTRPGQSFLSTTMNLTPTQSNSKTPSHSLSLCCFLGLSFSQTHKTHTHTVKKAIETIVKLPSRACFCL